jgi:predicted nuclease of predicted toxin-antitoxin system
MKLLFDQNLSPNLVKRLADIFPESAHVEALGLGKDGDLAIWNFAKDKEYAIVTKDGDFASIGAAKGFPPKIILVLLGNCSTDEVEAALRSDLSAIKELEAKSHLGILSIV